MMFHRPLTLDESKALAAWVAGGIAKVLDYMFWPLHHEGWIDPADIEDKREDPLLAIQFLIDTGSYEAVTFLKPWQEGDWETLQREWPEWVGWMAAQGIDVYYEPRLK